MTDQLLKLINPVHLLSCDEWMKVDELLNPQEHFLAAKKAYAFDLSKRYEEIGKLPLTKEMFIASKEVPEVIGTFKYDFKNETETYTESQKVLFAGFRHWAEAKAIYCNDYAICSVSFSYSLQKLFIEGDFVCKNPTIRDLVYHIDKYNETATQKIEIHVTEAFVKMICQNN